MYNFLADYDNTVDIHKHLMKKKDLQNPLKNYIFEVLMDNWSPKPRGI